MSDNIKVVVIGAGNMAGEYCKVLNALNIVPTVIGRSKENIDRLNDLYNIKGYSGGIENNMDRITPDMLGFVAVNLRFLSEICILLMKKGLKRILVEKPAGMSKSEIQQLYNRGKETDTEIYVAYNRRFYSSTETAMNIVESDGGVLSVNFEFTEWSHVIAHTSHTPEEKEVFLLANSTHVIDLAFLFAGHPKEMSCYVRGGLSWHKNGSRYVGAGVSERDVLFSYNANWEAPGRWGVEIMTSKHRLYLRPMEKLGIQEIGSVIINEAALDDKLDTEFKPGLYKEVRAFLNEAKNSLLCTIDEQLGNLKWYGMISGYDYE